MQIAPQTSGALGKKADRNFPEDALHLRISDDHDEVRASSLPATRSQWGARLVGTHVHTRRCAARIYNGMEVGDATASDGGALFSKRNISWQSKEHPELRSIYHSLDSAPPTICRAPQFARGLAA